MKRLGSVALVSFAVLPAGASSAPPPGPPVWVHPRHGHRQTFFKLGFRAPVASSADRVRHSVPIIEVTGPRVGYTCSARPVWTRLEKIPLPPNPLPDGWVYGVSLRPFGGWCSGRYRASVLISRLKLTPACAGREPAGSDIWANAHRNDSCRERTVLGSARFSVRRARARVGLVRVSDVRGEFWSGAETALAARGLRWRFSAPRSLRRRYRISGRVRREPSGVGCRYIGPHRESDGPCPLEGLQVIRQTPDPGDVLRTGAVVTLRLTERCLRACQLAREIR
jgi:hypothetical protein